MIQIIVCFFFLRAENTVGKEEIEGCNFFDEEKAEMLVIQQGSGNFVLQNMIFFYPQLCLLFASSINFSKKNAI